MQGYNVPEALTCVPGPPTNTFSRPSALVCVDGGTYWVKSNVQRGLTAELVAGRLAKVTGAGPEARVIRVTPEALPADGTLGHLSGVVVGVANVANTVNARELHQLLPQQNLAARCFSSARRALTIVFQSWIGVGDQQVLVNITNGHIFSIDHGECFGSASSMDEPTVVITDIPGIDPQCGRSRHDVLVAVERIEALTDREILNAVAQVPRGQSWDSDTGRRLQIGHWLAYRRGRIREVMEEWVAQP